MDPLAAHTIGEENSPYDILLGSMDALLGEWRALIRPEPWARIDPARLLDALPEILPRLIRLARDGAVHVDERLKNRIAEDHGYFRRVDAVPVTAVAEEWSAVKRACLNVLQRAGLAEVSALSVTERLDALIDDAVGYTLRGYYRPELDSLRGRGLERRDGSEDRRSGNGDRRGEDDGA
jgi:hypothetical protein